MDEGGTYCSDCFDSFEEHKQDVLGDEGELEKDGSIPKYEENCLGMEITRNSFVEKALTFIIEKEMLRKERLEGFEISDEDGHGYEATKATLP